MLQAVIYDMDGVLIDSEPFWRESMIEVFGRLGLHMTEEMCLETMGVRIGEVARIWYERHPWEGKNPAEVAEEMGVSFESLNFKYGVFGAEPWSE